MKLNKEIDELWVREVEGRIDAYDQGKLEAISLEKVLRKFSFLCPASFDEVVKSRKTPFLSFPRRRESSILKGFWTTAGVYPERSRRAGVTTKATFY
ncbi:MAG: addiction module protein [Deltaproteobacteria bacterium]|nr:addiction module protein [Deltaproteobacteria bacterium]